MLSTAAIVGRFQPRFEGVSRPYAPDGFENSYCVQAWTEVRDLLLLQRLVWEDKDIVGGKVRT